jgi:hypothetical protein
VTETACRLCGEPAPLPVLSLGTTPLANSLLTAAQLGGAEPFFPLDLALCRRCSLLQITETVPPEQLFSDYLYFSSFSETMLTHAAAIAERTIAERGLGPGSLVMEVASNDGYLLSAYARHGVPVLGIEPARNIAKVAVEKGIPTVCDFFGVEVATRLHQEGRLADVVHANNVLAHVPDLAGVATGFRLVLKPTGVGMIEVPYVKEMLDRVEFDTIYHEHLCYFSATAIAELMRRSGLELVHVEHLAIHGGSIRCHIAHAGARAVSAETQALLAEEAAWGVREPAAYLTFARRVEEVTAALVRTVRDLKAQGKRVAAYGAAAKGSTFLNYAGLGRDDIAFVVDRSPHKQGRFMPGVHIPIYAPERLLQERPDYVVLLTWNFADEILRQQAEFRAGGGRFIIPLPDVRIV